MFWVCVNTSLCFEYKSILILSVISGHRRYSIEKNNYNRNSLYSSCFLHVMPLTVHHLFGFSSVTPWLEFGSCFEFCCQIQVNEWNYKIHACNTLCVNVHTLYKAFIYQSPMEKTHYVESYKLDAYAVTC